MNKTSASPKNNLRIYKLESISNKNVSDVDTVQPIQDKDLSKRQKLPTLKFLLNLNVFEKREYLEIPLKLRHKETFC